MRKPSRMPILTQALTRQPVAVVGADSAARIVPEFSPAFNSSKASKYSGPYFSGVFPLDWRKSSSMRSASMGGFLIRALCRRGRWHQVELFEHLLDFGLALRRGRHQRQAIGERHQAHLRQR